MAHSRKWLRENGWNGEFYANFFEAPGEAPGGGFLRSWDDARKYGFISAGGARVYWHPLLMLEPGDRVWVKIPGSGFVGCGVVSASASPASSVTICGEPFFSLPLSAEYCRSRPMEDGEYIVLVKWLFTAPMSEAVLKSEYHNEQVVCRPHSGPEWDDTVSKLRTLWRIE